MGAVTRAALADAVYDACPAVTRREAADLVDHALEEISQALVSGESFKVSSFGTFTPHRKKARVGRNPKRPKEIAPIAPHTVILFKASPILKDQVDRGFDSSPSYQLTALQALR